MSQNEQKLKTKKKHFEQQQQKNRDENLTQGLH